MDLPAPGRQAGRALELDADLAARLRRLWFGLAIGRLLNMRSRSSAPLVNSRCSGPWPSSGTFPYKLPLEYGFSFSGAGVPAARQRHRSRSGNSLAIALFTVTLCTPGLGPGGLCAGAPQSGAARPDPLGLPACRQAFPSLAVYINVARIFYGLGLNGTITGVVLVHTMHGLVFSVWIATAAFAAVDRELEEAARSIGASPLRTFMTITLPLAAPGIMASAIFVFLEFLDEFTGTYFVGIPDVTTLPLLLFRASMEGNYQIASITALLLLVPSVGFMLFIERFLKADVLAKVGS